MVAFGPLSLAALIFAIHENTHLKLFVNEHFYSLNEIILQLEKNEAIISRE